MQVELTHNPSSEIVKKHWADLSTHTPGHAFLNECWITPWFDTVAKDHAPVLVVVKNIDSVVALAVIHILPIKRRGIFTRNVLYFNEVPTGQNDMVIEYNGLLCDEKNYDQAWSAVLAALKTELAWDEIKINKIDPAQVPAIKSAIHTHSLTYFHEREDTSPIAILATDSKWEDVEKLNISSNRRRQVRKARQLYEQKYGELTVQAITEEGEIDTFWTEMADLHTAHWNDKGDSGAFANSLWTTFNRVMISDWIQSGKIQLTKYCAGTTSIGYLFNLVVEDRAYNIQCGFLYESDNKLKPGFVCHHACMKICHEQGIQKYYYLAGGEDYKVSLSSQVDTLDWLCIRKSNKPFIVEDNLVELVRRIRPFIKK